MLKMICFDMDGTIADLYGVKGWLKDLHSGNTAPYENADAMWDMDRLAEVLQIYRNIGVEIRIITWLAKDADADYKARTRTVKRDWLDEYNFPYDIFHGVRYGATKADSVRKRLADNETAILIDDNAKVRKGWHLGETVNPQEVDIISYLYQLLETMI